MRGEHVCRVALSTTSRSGLSGPGTGATLVEWMGQRVRIGVRARLVWQRLRPLPDTSSRWHKCAQLRLRRIATDADSAGVAGECRSGQRRHSRAFERRSLHGAASLFWLGPHPTPCRACESRCSYGNRSNVSRPLCCALALGHLDVYLAGRPRRPASLLVRRVFFTLVSHLGRTRLRGGRHDVRGVSRSNRGFSVL